MAAVEDFSGRKRLELDVQQKTEILSTITRALNIYQANQSLAAFETAEAVDGGAEESCSASCTRGNPSRLRLRRH